MNPEEGAGSWEDTHLDTSYKGFFYVHIYMFVYF